jgi:hypothetical protein
MSNPWLASAQNKQMMKDIDQIAIDVWSQDGTLNDFFASLTDEQTDFLFSMKIKDFACDPTDLSCGFELNLP